MAGSQQGRCGGGPVADDSFWPVLHQLRARELRRLPPGARTILSGGCNGAWYFDWVRENYPSVERHIGVEAYLPRPERLPVGAEWIVDTLGDMKGVSDGEVDLVLAGQTIEHLWPEEFAGFLKEAHRVLKPGGWLALDSPNRRWTQAYGYRHPEHTLELTVDEILSLLVDAGFEVGWMRGVWLCYDSSRRRLLPLGHEPADPQWPTDLRVAAAESRPEDSFVWWVEARRTDRAPDVDRLLEKLQDLYAHVWCDAFGRMSHAIGSLCGDAPTRWVQSAPGQAGVLLSGPNIPMRAGDYVVEYRLRAPEGAGSPPDALLGELDVCSWNATTIHARRPIAAAELSAGREWAAALPFSLAQPTFGVEFRVHASGAAALASRFGVEVRERTDWSVIQDAPPSTIPLRHRLADRANDWIKRFGPLHAWLKRRWGAEDPLHR